MYQPERVTDLWCAILKRAVLDHCRRYQRKGLPSEYTFLRSAGLIDQRGQFVGRARDSVPSPAPTCAQLRTAAQGDA